MDITLFISIIGISLGLISFIFPISFILCKKWKNGAVCILFTLGLSEIAITSQMWYLRYCANHGNMSAVEDTINAFTYVMSLHAIFAIILSVWVVLVTYKRNK